MESIVWKEFGYGLADKVILWDTGCRVNSRNVEKEWFGTNIKLKMYRNVKVIDKSTMELIFCLRQLVKKYNIQTLWDITVKSNEKNYPVCIFLYMYYILYPLLLLLYIFKNLK